MGATTWERPQARPGLRRGKGLRLAPQSSVPSANLKQTDSHFRTADGERVWTGQEVRGCLGSSASVPCSESKFSFCPILLL